MGDDTGITLAADQGGGLGARVCTSPIPYSPQSKIMGQNPAIIIS